MDVEKSIRNAALSEASYANFLSALKTDDDTNKSKIVSALQRIGTKDGEPDDPDQGFSRSQATDFVTHWRLVDHQPDTASGFSAISGLPRNSGGSAPALPVSKPAKSSLLVMACMLAKSLQ